MIVELIRPVVTGLPRYENPEDGPNLRFTFYHSEPVEMNETDSPKVPFVLLAHPIIGKDKVSSYGVESTTYPLQLFFLTKSLLTKKMAERQGEINKMILAKDAFLKNVQAIIDTPIDPDNYPEYAFDEIISASHQEWFNEYDSNMDGIYLKAEIRIRKLLC